MSRSEIETTDESAFSSRSLGIRSSCLPDSESKQVQGAHQELMETLDVDVKHVVRALAAVWAEVGYSAEEQQLQLQKLRDELTQTLRAKLSQEVEVRDVFKKDIEVKISECEQVAAALGAQDDPSWAEIVGSLGELRLSHALMRLEREQVRLLELKAIRAAELEPYTQKIAQLAHRLELDISDYYICVGNEELSSSRLSRLENKLIELWNIEADRISKFAALENQSRALRRELEDDDFINTINDITEMNKQQNSYLPESEEIATLFIDADPNDLGANCLAKAQNRLQGLRTEKDNRLQRLQTLGSEISLLWERLEIPEIEQRKFRDMCASSSIRRATFRLGQAEVAKLKAQLRERVVDLVHARRDKIFTLWDELDIPESIRSQSAHFIEAQPPFDEELLLQHEELLDTLETKQANLQPLLRLIERREDLIDARLKLEKIQSDPGRLMRRGRGSAAERRIEMDLEAQVKQLPKLTELLLKKIPDWEAKEGSLHWRGERYLDTIKRSEAEWKQHKHDSKASKHKSAAPDSHHFHASNNKENVRT
uniref:Protein regulator of cytokinesis 1 n=1 Tax=Aureoumbra lagunensis TaxID=44058 RepID=A0A7S3NPN2_9STRA|mmetsp:Transcript_18915/g.28537  ORF Transcript_18915/g.28537 Transcript_18915/m.28537 type:complete len:542 (+) Transcript_18915:59-1684(+)